MPAQVHHGTVSMRTVNKMPSAVALGMFDGMHIGHQRVIAQAVELARHKGWQSVVYTFANHPRSVFAQAPAPLMTAGERRAAMLTLGVDQVDMVTFDKRMAELSPEAFLQQLADRYQLKALVAGSDYTFGYKGMGTVETLSEMQERYGYQLWVVPFVMLEGEKVSSTRIREALKRGESALAAQMLGKGEARSPQ